MKDRLQESYSYCRKLTSRTAGNFGYSFWALPARQRRAMDVLYAFMRLTDDIGDDATVPIAERAIRLERWHADLKQAAAGELPPHPVWPAVAELLQEFSLPDRLLADVIAGVTMDLTPRRFATFAELQNYCYHVAGAVGLCCIRIWGFQGDTAEARAIDCGLAFQLTNILRDLAEDSAQERLYLPQEDLRQFGYSEADLSQRLMSREFRNLMAYEVERAWKHYRLAEELMPQLAPAGRPVFRAMLKIYGGLLAEIENRGFDVFSDRVRLPVWKKIWFTATAIWQGQHEGQRVDPR